MKIKREKIAKIIRNITKYIIHIIMIICIIYNILFVLYTTMSQNEYFTIFGISLFYMPTELMSEEIEKNALVIVKNVEEQKLQAGDIIAYQINGKIRINKIIKKENEITTKSNRNYYPDIEKITSVQIIGKQICQIPILGLAILMLQSKILTIVIMLILILKLLYNRHMYNKRLKRIRKKNNFKVKEE